MTRRDVGTIALAGLATGISDGIFASVLSTVFYDSTFTRLWQGVAAVLLGPSAIGGGTRMVLIGLVMHFIVALAWSAVLFVLVKNLAWIRGVLASPFGALKVSSVYGPAIWMVMSVIVIPVMLQRPPKFTMRWLVQGIGHIPFVALPMASVIRARLRGLQ